MLLIIQTGDPLPQAQPYGEFADWFIDGLGVHADQADVVNVHREQSLPDWQDDRYCGVVITGSAAMVTEQTPWMRQTQRWLEKPMQHQVPVLGVCFGHQLLADMLGGRVAYNPAGRHMGLARFEASPQAAEDPLLGALPQVFNTLVSHQQVVTQLPASAVLLGDTAADPNHAFRWQDHTWGVQFHPEWTPDIMRAYINARATDLSAEGHDPAAMKQALQPCVQARSILQRFALLAHA
jgi:GMP synthase (glutamine-hydrolysing)